MLTEVKVKKGIFVLLVSGLLIFSGDIFGAERKTAFGFQLLDLGLFKASFLSLTNWVSPSFAFQPTLGFANVTVSEKHSARPEYNSESSVSMKVFGVNGLIKVIEENYMNIHIGAGLSRLVIDNGKKYSANGYSIFGGSEWFFDETPNLGFFAQIGYGLIEFENKETETYWEFDSDSSSYKEKSDEVTFAITPGVTMMRWGIHYYF